MVTYIGIFTIILLKLMYKIPWPFWIDSQISGKTCDLDFSGPSDHAFMITFFYSYNIIIFFHWYSEEPKTRLVAFLIGLNVFVWIFVSFGLTYMGNTYLLESLLGGIFGFAYTMILIYFDSAIHELCENTGFIVRESRRYKFYVFFACLGLLSFAVIYYNADLTNWRVE